MATKTETQQKPSAKNVSKIGEMFGRMYSFNNSLKLYHWHVTGRGSYAEHMALDQALESLGDVMDRIVETSYSYYGTIEITIPQTNTPQNIVQHAADFYKYIEDSRDILTEKFMDSIMDDYQEATQQLLYRLRRLE